MKNNMQQRMNNPSRTLKIWRMGINTYQEPVVYMRQDCHVCRAEGFEAQSRIRVQTSKASIIATLNILTDSLLEPEYIGLSEAAWQLLHAHSEEVAIVGHAEPVDSLAYIRAKIYKQELSAPALNSIIHDIAIGLYSDVHLSSFITACAGNNLNLDEITRLTQAMVHVGDRLDWGKEKILDKHCVGGLPGNRTTPIVVAIVSACGGIIPKTSSRAITSPSGTADTIETLMPVELSLPQMRRVVEQQGGCMVWGGSANLSPTDDILIRVERVLDIDSEGQLIASVLSKKIAAGASHIVLDFPVGPTAKVRSMENANRLIQQFAAISHRTGLELNMITTDGAQPVGYGIGPALEALDVLAVLQNKLEAPADLREKSLLFAARLLEMGELASPTRSLQLARQTLETGKAWEKFQAIAEAQGGLREPILANHHYIYKASDSGKITAIHNRLIARLAKLAGAPAAKSAGIRLHVRKNDSVQKGQPLLTLHAETPGELEYALAYLKMHPDIFTLDPDGSPT